MFFRPEGKLSPGEFALMDVIAEGFENRSIKPSELSEKMRMTKPAVSKALNSLEEKGMVERIIDPDDRRGVRIRITEAGKSEHRKSLCAFEDMTCRILERMGEKDSEDIIRLIEKFYAILSEMVTEDGKLR